MRKLMVVLALVVVMVPLLAGAALAYDRIIQCNSKPCYGGRGQDKILERIGDGKPDTRPEVLPEEALPWIDLEPSVELDNEVASVYFSYLVDRPDSVLAALRTIAYAPGAALVHCAAGKDRTGTLVALALSVADADRQAIIDDYAASSDRVEGIVSRLLASPTYADNLEGRPISSHRSHPETMISFLRHIDDAFGGVEPMLIKIGWTAADSDQMRAKLRG